MWTNDTVGRQARSLSSYARAREDSHDDDPVGAWHAPHGQIAQNVTRGQGKVRSERRAGGVERETVPARVGDDEDHAPDPGIVSLLEADSPNRGVRAPSRLMASNAVQPSGEIATASQARRSPAIGNGTSVSHGQVDGTRDRISGSSRIWTWAPVDPPGGWRGAGARGSGRGRAAARGAGSRRAGARAGRAGRGRAGRGAGPWPRRAADPRRGPIPRASASPPWAARRSQRSGAPSTDPS